MWIERQSHEWMDSIWFLDEANFYLNESEKKCAWGSDICWVKTFACGQNPFLAAIWSTGIVRLYFLWFWWRMYEWERNINKHAEKNFFYQPFNLIQPTSRVSGNNKIEWLHTQLQECLVRRHIFRTISFTQNWKPWVPHSPDLNPFDFFLWWYLKDCLYWQSWWDKETEEQY